jgi:hypothetical protein
LDEVIKLNAQSPTEDMRQRFEAFVRSGCREDEASAFLTRSVGGEYVLPATKAGWASWQAAIQDLIEQYKLAANDEDGLTEFADVMVAARAALSWSAPQPGNRPDNNLPF